MAYKKQKLTYNRECGSRDCEVEFKTTNRIKVYCQTSCAKREIRKKAEDRGIKHKCNPKRTITCHYRNCTNKFQSRIANAKYCCPKHAKAEAYMVKADKNRPDRNKKHMTYALEVKNSRFKIPKMSAEWLQTLWDKRKEREAV